MKANRWESFLTSWKFFSLLVVLQFILMPVATKDFRFEAAGDIVFYTLQHAFIMDMYSYSFYFQVVMILALIAVVVWKGKFSRVFTAITGCFYLLYAVIQNMAVTGQHGFTTTSLIMTQRFTSFLRRSWTATTAVSLMAALLSAQAQPAQIPSR